MTTHTDIVHTITDWYDGARAGVADFSGKPHYYECLFTDNYTDVYLLKPLEDETFRLAMEDWNIWLRWEEAFRAGRTTEDTHPALPEDRERYNELTAILETQFVVNPDTCIKAIGEFQYGEPTFVKWTVIL